MVGMLNYLILIQTPQDVTDLAAAIPVLKRQPVAACWVVYSPAVVVDVKQAHAELDTQILARTQAMREASGREDFNGAEQHRVERDALVIKKAAVATDGVKASTPEQRAAMADTIFGPFYEGLKSPQITNLEITEHTQHYERKDWNEMLNSMRGRWPTILTSGNYIITWPGQIAEMEGKEVTGYAGEKLSYADALKKAAAVELEQMKNVAPPAPTIKKERKPNSGYTGSPRFKFLCALGIDALGQEAFKAGIQNPKGTRMGLCHQIAKAELEKGTLVEA